MKIVNKANNSVIAEDVIVAKSFFSRTKGLLGRKKLDKGCALILDPCNSIHMFFMRFPIDVLFLDKDNKVIKAISRLKPFRITRVYFKAVRAIELPSGTIEATSTKEGQTVSLLL